MNFLKRRFFAVEPFGLFQILNSFLNQNPKNAPQAEAGDTDESEKPLDQPEQKTNAEPQSEIQADSSNQAILSFMQAHETRAKRIKKL